MRLIGHALRDAVGVGVEAGPEQVARCGGVLLGRAGVRRHAVTSLNVERTDDTAVLLGVRTPRRWYLHS